MRKNYCLLGFHNFKNSVLDTFASHVKNGIYTNPSVFTSPPLTILEIEELYNKFIAAAADYKSLGITKRTAYLLAMKNLKDALDVLAVYVDGVANGDVSKISLAGFKPSKDQFVRVPDLEKIENFHLKRTDTSGGAAVEIPAIIKKGNISYCCVASEGKLTNPSLKNGQIVLSPRDTMVYQDYNRSRRKVFEGLSPGKEYYFYVFANNSASVSPISDAKSLVIY